ncbi:biotin--[acetyl-CoA-carboxylase] ligase [Nocardioides terrisoli]|uniref:biotin--[acetyl-CoA-carboxylase] ligase n=1 Tax=Nocardioides terrisoli TaxID=3388267 RepID=UPI00287B933C|nr:biotin--[acetyl-CoA-carboxylase] ligase [Nocardioides marmorisolisilvae]
MSPTPAPRSPLGQPALQEAAGSQWVVTLLPSTPSTNAVAVQQPAPGSVVVADHQTAGRGRLDRSWQTPPGTALTFSAVVDPGLPDARWPLVPLAAGLAVAEAVRRCGVDAVLKWPNDVLVEGAADGAEGKLAGILVERTGQPPRAVIGIGINVDLDADELPVPTATSLSLAGARVDRTMLLGLVLAALAEHVDALRVDPVALVAAYRERCATLTREVEVQLPGGRALRGTAVDVDVDGRLVVIVDGERVPVGAGDVLHVRPAG